MTSVASKYRHLVQTLDKEGAAQTFKIGTNISLGRCSMVIEEQGFIAWSPSKLYAYFYLSFRDIHIHGKSKIGKLDLKTV
jgi:hypothetical protein